MPDKNKKGRNQDPSPNEDQLGENAIPGYEDYREATGEQR